MRSRRSRRWTGPRRSCRCSPAWPNGAPTTTSGTAPRPCSAALEIGTGQVTAACKPRHRHQEFLAFLKQVARAYPAQDLHLVMDNYAAHKHPAVRAWLAANPRVHVHFTPTHASWMNLVEVWFSLIERQAIHRGTFGSVKDLNAKIRAYIDGWKRPLPPLRVDQDRRPDPRQSQPSEDLKRGALDIS
jgi:transposase